jgi:release factor glutamine methyltransferase
MKIKNLGTADLAKVEELRAAQLLRYSRLAAEGAEMAVNYEDRDFLVGPNIFWPGEDSKALVRNFRIQPGEAVLDVGAGSGVLAIFAAAAGAAKVVGLEINEDAVAYARKNAAAHGFADRIDFRYSDMFGALCEDEKFDVIVSNPPMTCRKPNSILEASFFDDELRFQQAIFQYAHIYLKENGRLYLTQCNFGAGEDLQHNAEQAGYDIMLIGGNQAPGDVRVFYAFELTKA